MEKDNKMYLITIVDNIDDNETAVYHEGVVVGSLDKAFQVLRKRFYGHIQSLFDDWKVDEDDTLNDYFTINEDEDKYEYNATSDSDHIQAYIEELDVIG